MSKIQQGTKLEVKPGNLYIFNIESLGGPGNGTPALRQVRVAEILRMAEQPLMIRLEYSMYEFTIADALAGAGVEEPPPQRSEPPRYPWWFRILRKIFRVPDPVPTTPVAPPRPRRDNRLRPLTYMTVTIEQFMQWVAVEEESVMVEV